MMAEIEIECKYPAVVREALETDIEEAKKFDVKIKDEKNKIFLLIESKDIAGLLAGINSYLRLVRTAIEASEA